MPARGAAGHPGRRGRSSDPLYRARRTLHTGADLLTDRQKARLSALFTGDVHVEVEATWHMYQRAVAAYREPDRTKGRAMMAALIGALSAGVLLAKIGGPGQPNPARRVDTGSRAGRP
jgi:hypothetical protein